MRTAGRTTRISVRALVLALLLVAGMLPARAAGHVEELLAFDAAAGQFTEGIAIDKTGNVFLSVTPLGQLWKLGPGDITPSLFGTLPGSLNEGDLGPIGLAVDAPGNVYGGVFSTNADLNGVWRFDRKTGSASRIPGSDQIGFANAVAFDKRGNLYVTDTLAGAVWRIDPGGTVSVWKADPLLQGNGALGFGIPLGANGIAYRHGVIYVTVTEQGTVVQIPVARDGSAGDATILSDAPELFAADGMALDVHGDLYVAVIGQSHVVKVDADTGDVAVVATGGPVRDTSSVAFGTGKGERRSLFAVNYGILSGLPGLIKIDLDVAGMPLP